MFVLRRSDARAARCSENSEGAQTEATLEFVGNGPFSDVGWRNADNKSMEVNCERKNRFLPFVDL